MLLLNFTVKVSGNKIVSKRALAKVSTLSKIVKHFPVISFLECLFFSLGGVVYLVVVSACHRRDWSYGS
jgi:hypothetical protein